MFVLLLLGTLGLVFLWQATEVGKTHSFQEMVMRVRASGAQVSLPFALGALALASILAVPLGAIFVISAALFGPWWGLTYAMIAAIVGGAVNFLLGGYFGHVALRRLAGVRINAISERLARRGVLSVIIIRMIPIAPYAIVNLVAGTTHIRLWQFLVGSVIGMLPGGLVISVFADSLMVWLHSGVASISGWLIGLLVVAVIGIVSVVIRFVGQSSKPH